MDFALGVSVDPVSPGMVLPSRNFVPLMLFREAAEYKSPSSSQSWRSYLSILVLLERGFSTCTTGVGRQVLITALPLSSIGDITAL